MKAWLRSAISLMVLGLVGFVAAIDFTADAQTTHPPVFGRYFNSDTLQAAGGPYFFHKSSQGFTTVAADGHGAIHNWAIVSKASNTVNCRFWGDPATNASGYVVGYISAGQSYNFIGVDWTSIQLIQTPTGGAIFFYAWE